MSLIMKWKLGSILFHLVLLAKILFQLLSWALLCISPFSIRVNIMANKPLRRTDKKDTSLFAKFSEQDIKTAELAFMVSKIDSEFKESIKRVDNTNSGPSRNNICC